MHEVIVHAQGTARNAFHALTAMGCDSAGKTGSAEVGGGGRTHSWYAGYAPSQEPVLAYSLVVENAGHGSEAAVPIMADIMNRIYKDPALVADLGLPAPRPEGAESETEEEGGEPPPPDVIPEEGVPAAERSGDVPLMIISE